MKYVVIGYLKHVKGYSDPYDIFICKDYDTLNKVVNECLSRMDRYSHFEQYKHIGIKGYLHDRQIKSKK